MHDDDVCCSSIYLVAELHQAIIKDSAIVCLSVISVNFMLQITRQEVNSFKSTSGTRIPKCELVAEWVQDTPPVRLQHSISLIGAHDHHNFMLHINPGEWCWHTIIGYCIAVTVRGNLCLLMQMQTYLLPFLLKWVEHPHLTAQLPHLTTVCQSFPTFI